MPRVIHVLLPTGTKVEAREARRVLDRPGVELVIGSAPAHTPGQVLNGDVVIVGNRHAGVIERDATGKVERFADMDALVSARAAPSVTAAASLAATAGAAPLASAAAGPPASPEAGPGVPFPASNGADLEKMERGPLIKHAAERFPKQRPWATMPSREIRKAIAELEAAQG